MLAHKKVDTKSLDWSEKHCQTVQVADFALDMLCLRARVMSRGRTAGHCILVALGAHVLASSFVLVSGSSNLTKLDRLSLDASICQLFLVWDARCCLARTLKRQLCARAVTS